MRLMYLCAALAITVTLAGCTTSNLGFGSVVQHNIAAQIIELDPVYAGVPIEGGSGERGATAVARYNRGAVKTGSGGGGAAAAPAAAPPS